jgi:hypothetical protein
MGRWAWSSPPRPTTGAPDDWLIASDTNPDECPAAQVPALITKPAREIGKERRTRAGQEALTATEGPTSTTSHSPIPGVTQKT